MPTTNRRKHFRRIFAILSILWIAYLVVIAPIQLRHRSQTRLSERLATCTHLSPDHQITYDGECMDLAEHLYVIDKSAASRYFSPTGVLILLTAALGLPLALYGLLAGFAVLFRYRRQTHHPDGPPQSNLA